MIPIFRPELGEEELAGLIRSSGLHLLEFRESGGAGGLLRAALAASGGALVALAVAFLFMPPVDPAVNSTLWFGTWMFLLFFFWTLVTVPYESLGPEITFDYAERTTVFAIRDGLLIAGTIAAAAAHSARVTGPPRASSQSTSDSRARAAAGGPWDASRLLAAAARMSAVSSRLLRKSRSSACQ